MSDRQSVRPQKDKVMEVREVGEVDEKKKETEEKKDKEREINDDVPASRGLGGFLKENFARVFGESAADVMDETMAEEALRARVRRNPEEPTSRTT